MIYVLPPTTSKFVLKLMWSFAMKANALETSRIARQIED